MGGIFGLIPTSSAPQHNTFSAFAKTCEAMASRGKTDPVICVFSPQKNEILTKNSGAAPSTGSVLVLGCIAGHAGTHQPVAQSPCGRYSLVYDGAIYNIAELQNQLPLPERDHAPATEEEVLLAWLMSKGTAALEKVTGMFAFALYDKQENTLTLGRDFFGAKPLYWYAGPSGFAFASTVPALLHIPGTPRNINPTAAYQYLCFGTYDTGTQTMLQNVYSVAPASCLTVKLNTPQTNSAAFYWQPNPNKECTLPFAKAAERAKELFLESIELHLRGSAHFGVALSGGIDSSAIACAVRHLHPKAELHSFSFIAPGSSVSEEHWARLVAENIAAISHWTAPGPDEFLDDMDGLITIQGEPFGSTSLYAQYKTFQLVSRQGFSTTLDGQGGDELLAGYHGYPGQRTSTLLRQGKIVPAIQFLRACKQWPGRSWGYLAQQTIREFTPQWLVPFAMQCAGVSLAPAWLNTSALKKTGAGRAPAHANTDRFPSPFKLKQTLATQLVWNGLPRYLRHGDRNSAAFSVESRLPFLTKDLADFFLSLPEEYLVSMQGRSKNIFREAMRGIVPDVILDRRDKVGFRTPEKEWLLTMAPWIDKTLASAQNVPYLHVSAIQQEWQATKKGTKKAGWNLWRLLNYIRWATLFDIQAA